MTPFTVSDFDESLLPLDKPLTTLQKGGIFALCVPCTDGDWR
jgi:hypothetical protein